MDIIIIILLVVLLLETTYLAYHSVTVIKKIAKHMTFIDSSVLIDGRIVNIAKSGFLPSGFVIPRSVIGELQFLADNADHDKRTRARHGLDVAHQLRSMENVEVGLFQDSVKAEEGVDNRLLSLAKKYEGSICTIDYNLNKVAKVEGIEVLNVNELNKDLRSAYLPGETTEIAIKQKGQDSAQGVGYLEDGTMVVVDSASRFIGKTVEIEITRMLQTDAGRMMFAKLRNKPDTSKKESPAPAKRASGRGRPSTTSATKTVAESTPAPIPVPTLAPSPSPAKKAPARQPAKESAKAEQSKPERPRANRSKTSHSKSSAKSGRPPSRQSQEDKLLNLIDNQ